MQKTSKLTRHVKAVQIDCSKPVLTDQSFKKSCDINNIVKSFMKTGMLPPSRKEGHYGDFSEVPTLEASFNAAQLAQEAFYDLPSDIRKLMDNDASKLELWLSDENNHEMAYQHGLLEKKAQAADTVKHDNISTDTGAANATTSD